MELEHNFTVAAPVDRAWEVLLDLERIAPCMPGATLTSSQGDEFTGDVRVKLGPVTMTFAGNGRFVERDPQARRIVVEASGKDKRGGGAARATITATLAPEGTGASDGTGDGDATAVAVHSDLVVTGRAAQFGRGMIADVSTRLLGQFTECLSGKLASPAQAATPATASPVPEPPVGEPPVGEPSAPVEPPAPVEPRAPEPPPAPAVPHAPAAPIDLLGVTGVRAAVGRAVPYLLVFVLGALVGGGLVALLIN